MGKLRNEVICQKSHSAIKWQSWELNSDLSTSSTSLPAPAPAMHKAAA